jgi:hypothetical protein
MARKPKLKPKSDNPEQSKRFKEAAREAEADESEEGADRAFKKATKPSGSHSHPSGNRASS